MTKFVLVQPIPMYVDETKITYAVYAVEVHYLRMGVEVWQWTVWEMADKVKDRVMRQSTQEYQYT